MTKIRSIIKRTEQQYKLNKNKLRELPDFPRNMMVELSNACNHACLFCTSPFMTRKIKRIDNDFLIRILKDAYTCGTRELGFYTTGEPFIYKDLDKIIKVSKDMGYEYIYISTNGALAKPEISKKVINAGIDSIKFSINATDQKSYHLIHGKDDWSKVIDNLKFISNYRKANDLNFALYITTVVTKIIEKSAEKFKHDIREYVDEVQLISVHDQGGYMNKASELLKSDTSLYQAPPKSSDTCMLPFNRLHVTSEGYLTACCVDYQNYLAIADLKNMTLKEAWNSQEFVKLRKRHLEKKLGDTLCNNCWNNCNDKVKPLNQILSTFLDNNVHGEFVKKTVENRIKKF